MLEDFAVFILSHGRANNVITYKTLKRDGYTGRIYIIIDNEDAQADQYYQHFGNKVIIFDKAKKAQDTDTGDNFNGMQIVVFARNACFDIAKSLGLEYFMVLDDDYTSLRYKTDSNFNYIDREVLSTDTIFSLLLNFYKSIDCYSLAIAQGGDFIGGKWNKDPFRVRRKVMNSFICSTSRPFNFFGRINEDVNVYTSLGNKGKLFLTFPMVAIQQIQTQQNNGGLTDIYLEMGTYVKSFYTIMYQPSSTKIALMGVIHERLHHLINWDCTVPCIISEKYRKIEPVKAG